MISYNHVKHNARSPQMHHQHTANACKFNQLNKRPAKELTKSGNNPSHPVEFSNPDFEGDNVTIILFQVASIDIFGPEKPTIVPSIGH